MRPRKSVMAGCIGVFVSQFSKFSKRSVRKGDVIMMALNISLIVMCCIVFVLSIFGYRYRKERENRILAFIWMIVSMAISTGLIAFVVYFFVLDKPMPWA